MVLNRYLFKNVLIFSIVLDIIHVEQVITFLLIQSTIILTREYY